MYIQDNEFLLTKTRISLNDVLKNTPITPITVKYKQQSKKPVKDEK